MKRRDFLSAGIFGSVGLASGIPAYSAQAFNKDLFVSGVKMRGLSLEALAADYRRQLFDDYLPFWELGGYDRENGGFMCYLYDDGTVQDDRKDIWYQGRGIWVYSFLYNNIDRNEKWLEMARSSRNFMVEHMLRDDYIWLDTVNRVGEPVSGLDRERNGSLYGALFAAVGLIQFAKATGRDEDLQIAKKTLRKVVERYEDPSHGSVTASGVSEPGLRAQGVSFMLVWVIPQLIEIEADPWLEKVARTHLDRIANNFWNPEYGISNEVLFHDYSRIPSLSDWMVPGHSIETQWMGMQEAMRIGDAVLAKQFEARLRRLIEMSWDYVYGGYGDTSFRVSGSDSHPQGPDYSLKAMWAHTEVLVGCMMAYANTGESWALDFYERAWTFIDRTMTTDHGVWRQAVDRKGENMDRPGLSIYRKGNFHQPRCLMLNLLQVEKMIARGRSV